MWRVQPLHLLRVTPSGDPDIDSIGVTSGTGDIVIHKTQVVNPAVNDKGHE